MRDAAVYLNGAFLLSMRMAALIPELWTRGWRGPLLAGLVALFAALPAAFFLPLVDRQEARTVQATAQMLETGDFVAISFQDRLRDGEPVGVHWLQALSVATTSKVEQRFLLAYRLPSLLAAALIAAACAWAAAGFMSPGRATTAGLIAGASFGVSVAGGLAVAQTLTAAGATLAIAAIGRLYAETLLGKPAGRRCRVLLWIGLALGLLCGGWLPTAAALIVGLTLLVYDRSAPWARSIGWGWGIIALAALAAPWALAVTVATDGGYWTTSAADHASWTPPGGPTLMAILFLFPFCALAPAGIAQAWRERSEPGHRFALAWLLAAIVATEFNPDRTATYGILILPPLAMLSAAALGEARPRWSARLGSALLLTAAAILAAACIILLMRYGRGADAIPGVLAAIAFAVAGVIGAVAARQNRHGRRLVFAGAAGLAAQGLLVGALLPRLEPLWPSQEAVRALVRHGLHPRAGLVQGPVTVAGFAEPSLIFALGARTEVGKAKDAAAAIGENRPVIVERREEAAFRRELASAGLRAQAVASVSGLDYADGRAVDLTVWRRALQ